MPTVDFAILTGLVEEMQAVLDVFPEAEEVAENADVWYRTRVRAKNGENYEVVAAYQTGMGPLAAHDLTAKVIARWDPAYIILVGIAGSFNKDVKLGDVIVSQQVFYYDQGKATSGGISYRPEGYPCSATLIRQAEALQLDKGAFESWQDAANASAALRAEGAGVGVAEKSRAQIAGTLRGYRPAIHYGTVASGSLVVADEKKQKELLLLHGKIIGTEMEGAGVLHATFGREVPTPAVVIKGISDAADADKDAVDAEGHWRELAKESPARLALEIIRRGKIRPTRADQFSLDPGLGSAAEARQVIKQVSAPGVSYLSFPRLVIPKGPLTGVRVEVAVTGEGGPLGVSELVLQYTDWEGKVRSEVVTEAPYVAELNSPLPAAALSLYMLVLGKASRVTFTVVTANTRAEAAWSPGA